MAKAIIAGRPYKSFEDLDGVRGMGRRRLESLRGRITFNGSDTSETAASSASTRVLGRQAARPTATERCMQRLAQSKNVNINTATLGEPDILPGIGPVRAQAIIDAREAEPFRTIEDIMKVKRIKEGEFARIKNFIRVK
jgi:competence protein ComEA